MCGEIENVEHEMKQLWIKMNELLLRKLELEKAVSDQLELEV
jgi:hypothetical protein